MLAQLQGVFEGETLNGIIINVQGIGFEVHVAPQTKSRLPHIGNLIKIETLFLFRQEQPQLFGFLSKKEKEIFEILLTVQGVGPRVGLAMLGSYSPSKLLWIFKSDDKKALTMIEGIGPKLASRLLNELKDKLEKLTAISLESTSEEIDIPPSFSKKQKKKENSSEETSGKADIQADLFYQEATLALEALGYEKNHIFSAIHEVYQEQDDVAFASTQEVIKLALKKLSPVVASRGSNDG